METIALGSNGPQVPFLCVGTWAWGDKIFWGYGKDYGADQLRDAFKAAVELGLTFFDTAEIYGSGLSEQLIAQFQQESDRPIQIATKYAPFPWRWGKQAVIDALSNSLKRLQTDSVILYQVHWPVSFLMSQETLMNALADEVQRGRTVTVGISNYSAQEMRTAHRLLAQRGVALAVNQVRYSLLARNVETQGIVDTAKELGVTLLAYSPLAQGLLTGKYTPEQAPTPSDARRVNPRFRGQNLQKLYPLIQLMREMGERHGGKTVAQVALNWLIAQGNIIPIAGAKSADQVRQNAGALGWKLTPDEVEQLRQTAIAYGST